MREYTPISHKAKFGSTKAGFVGIKATKELQADLRSIGDLLAPTTNGQGLSVSASARHAIHFYAMHLRRLGEAQRLREVRTALRGTYAAQT